MHLCAKFKITVITFRRFLLVHTRDQGVPGVLGPPTVKEKSSSYCKTIQERQNSYSFIAVLHLTEGFRTHPR
jgi:hypothetical protein